MIKCQFAGCPREVQGRKRWCFEHERVSDRRLVPKTRAHYVCVNAASYSTCGETLFKRVTLPAEPWGIET